MLLSSGESAEAESEEPCGRDRRASEIEYLFSVSFPLVGNPSDLFGIARKILDKPE
jgi:hypothetical protein